MTNLRHLQERKFLILGQKLIVGLEEWNKIFSEELSEINNQLEEATHHDTN